MLTRTLYREFAQSWRTLVCPFLLVSVLVIHQSCAVAHGDELPLAPRQSFEQAFYDGLAAVHETNFALAGDRFSNARRLGAQEGYTRFPEFSLILIREATTAFERGRSDEGSFLLRRAGAFSPNDASIHAILAGFPQASRTDRIADGQAAWWSLRHDILASAACGVNALLVFLAALTVTLLMVMILHVCRHAQRFYDALSVNLPRELRGIGTPLLMASALLLPMALGLLGLLACWSLLLGRALTSSRRLPLAVGVTCILWGLSIPIISALIVAVNSPATRSLSAVNSGAYFGHGTMTLQHDLQLRSSDDLRLMFLNAKASALQGRDHDAERIFQMVMDRSEAGSRLHTATAINLAAMLYREKRYDESLALLTPLVTAQVSTFELYYNLSLAELAKLDTTAHRTAYAQLIALDRARLTETEALLGESGAPLLTSLPESEFLPLLLRIPQDSPQTLRRIAMRSEQLASTLLRGADPYVLVGLGVVLMALGMVIRPVRAFVRPVMTQFDDETSAERSGSWLDDLHATIVLGTTWIGCVMAIFEAPVHFLHVHADRPPSADPLFFGVVVGVAGLISVLTLVGRRISLNHNSGVE